MHLGGTTIPDSIGKSGRYLINREVLRYNGDGEAVTANYSILVWTFPLMTISDFTWIATTLLSGNYSVKYTSASLKNDLGTDTSYTNAVAYRPTYGVATGGWLADVTWEIKRIR